MRTILLIAGNDLRQQLRSGTLLLFAVVLPLGLAFLFGTVISPGEPRLNISYAVADADGGELATAFTDGVLGELAADRDFQVTPAATATAARQLVADGQAQAAFLIPSGFTEAVRAGQDTTITVVGDAQAGIAVAIAREIAQAYAAELRAVQLAVTVAAGADPAADPAQLAERAAAAAAPVTLAVDASAASRELSGGTYSAAGMAVFFLFFTAMMSVTTLLAERNQGTMARLLASPTSRPGILVGKLLGSVIVGLAAMAVLVGASTLVLGADWGDPRGVAVLVVAVVLAATGLTALLASFARTAEQASNWLSVVAVVFGLFGGAFVPLAQLGQLAAISYATPHRWFLQGLSDLAGGELSSVLLPAAVLVALAVTAFTGTLLRIDKVVRV